MPNWCENKLVISTPNEKGIEELQKFKKMAKRGKNPLSLGRFIIIPKELKNTESPNRNNREQMIKLYGAEDWYHWNLLNFGTKWDIEDAILMLEQPYTLEYQFDTAWSPPDEGIKKIARIFKNLLFELNYYETGANFRGYLEVQGKNIIEERYWNMTRQDYIDLDFDLEELGLDPITEEEDFDRQTR